MLAGGGLVQDGRSKGIFTSCEARRGGSQVHILMFSASSSRHCGCIS